ncbi:LysR substrate-binding domain-containing protein [Paracoccus sp. (in: a-proteobacteria)]|uniref:LysR substrate-binding domain-containing protein n=1 Tax=Paracoccus sp. TaxID=267 RepID=UPI0035AF3C94
MSVSRRRLPPLNALRAFEVAGRKLSFRAAADELGVTQGAVAQQIRLLEEHLGLALFKRLPRGVALTPQGAVYLAGVGRAFDTLSEATGQLLQRADTITISVTPTFAAKLLIPRLADLAAAVPGVELRTLASEVISDFDRDGVDIAVRLTRPPFPSGLEARLLFRQDLVAVASPHLVGNMALPLDAARLRGLPLLHDAHDHWPMFLPGAAKLPGAVFNQTTLALDAALAGQGVAIVARAVVMADIAEGRLLQVAQSGQTTGLDYYIVRKRRAQPAKTLDAVWNWCLARLSFS